MSSAAYLSRLAAVLASLDPAAIDQGTRMVLDAWSGGRQIIVLGNGGSALTALHYVTDWGKATLDHGGLPLRGRTLLDNIGTVTAYANDCDYADIFVRQLANVATPGDLVVLISGSGNSENVLRAAACANAIGCATLGLVGFAGGKLIGLVQHAILVPVHDMQMAEDVHAIFGHIVTKALFRTHQPAASP